MGVSSWTTVWRPARTARAPSASCRRRRFRTTTPFSRSWHGRAPGGSTRPLITSTVAVSLTEDTKQPDYPTKVVNEREPLLPGCGVPVWAAAGREYGTVV